MPWRRSPSCATGPDVVRNENELDIHSLYAITGAPKSAQALCRYSWIAPRVPAKTFTPLAPRRVRPTMCSLAPPGCSLSRALPDLLLLIFASVLIALPIYHIDLRFARHFRLHNRKVMVSMKHGGDEGARTPDLDSAIVALSQLSYIPWAQTIISYQQRLVNRFSGLFPEGGPELLPSANDNAISPVEISPLVATWERIYTFQWGSLTGLDRYFLVSSSQYRGNNAETALCVKEVQR